jgi:hypothetical protein
VELDELELLDVEPIDELDVLECPEVSDDEVLELFPTELVPLVRDVDPSDDPELLAPA